MREKAGLKHWFVEQDSSDKDIFESIKQSKKTYSKTLILLFNLN